MSASRWQRVAEIFDQAAELAPEARPAFLAEVCAQDDSLREEVESLLAHDGEQRSGFLNANSDAAQPIVESLSGKTIGPYHVLERIGAGGMGVVYKARDTRLGREVALKTTREEFSGRFRREARAISALNHPNICTLFDVGPDYLVMELVEGANLAGPVPIDTAIGYARQIAAGLEAAHEKGIIHRDLKPANIKVTGPASGYPGTVKILDFGLAKAAEAPATGGATVSLTEKGLILGTAAYMSPEQARGEAVDKRADIWAFGVILYELLTGKTLFGDSKNVSDVIAAVLTGEPDFRGLPKDTPPRMRHLLARCLRKDPKQRLRDIGDARILLDEPEPEVPASPVRRRRWLWVTGFATLAALAAFAGYRWLAGRPSGPFQRIQITRLTDSGKATAAAISPDGKYVVHAITDEGKSSLWLLHAATGSNVQILPPAPGTFSNLNFSRDGNSMHYVFDTGKPPPTMYTMPVLGGNARTLAAFGGRTPYSANASITDASFSPDEKRLVFTRADGTDSGLFLFNLDGSGERQLAARKYPEFLGCPAWSPDGKTIAYGDISLRGGQSSGLAARPVEDGPEKRIGSRIGYDIPALLWLPDGRGLVANANPQLPLLQVWYVSYPGGQVRRITNDLNSYSGLSLTGDGGALVTVQTDTTSHIWVVAPGDPGSAREIGTGHLDGLGYLAWAGNGNIYFEAPDSGGDTQIWITAADGTGRRQITREAGLTGQPAPCGDDRQMVFASYRAGNLHIFRSDLDGGNIRQLTNGEGERRPSCCPDGAWLIYGSPDPKNGGIWRMAVDGGAPVRIWDQFGWSRISPDGKSVLVGGKSVLVDTEAKAGIIPADGGQPIRSFDLVSELGGSGVVQWSADGTALVYVKTTGGVSNIWQRPLDGGEPTQLTAFTSQRITTFAVSRDGKRLALARGTTGSDVVLIRDLK